MELPPPVTPFIKAVRKQSQEDYKGVRYDGVEPDPERMSKIAKKHNQEMIGSGAFRVVLPHPTSAEKVVALENGTTIVRPEHAKHLYYSQRILNALFPHNFPAIYASFGMGGNSEGVSGTVRQKIAETESKTKIKYPIKEALRKCRKIGLNFEIDDSHPHNIMVGEDGGEYYIEPVNIDVTTPLDIARIERYMRGKGYPEETIKIAIESANRDEEIALKDRTKATAGEYEPSYRKLFEPYQRRPLSGIFTRLKDSLLR